MCKGLKFQKSLINYLIKKNLNYFVFEMLKNQTHLTTPDVLLFLKKYLHLIV